MADAARLPGSPAYLPRLASRMLIEGKDPDTALALLAAMEAQETDETRRDVIRRRIRDVVVERDILLLERAVAEYREAAGHLPAGLGDLVRGGQIARIPAEPNGGTYRIGADGAVRSDRMKDRMKVFQPR